MSNVYSVTQINSYIKNMFAQDYMLSKVSVKGEVSNCKYHNTGHIYFTIKDSGGTLSAVMFAGWRKGLSFELHDGMQVVITGSVEIYEKTGAYQIYAKKIEKEGLGDLYEKYLKLKQELEEMGMFALEYKQDIPKFAQKIGIVTALKGAALQDIINISLRRNPFVQLVLCPALVQGEHASISIAKAIKKLDDEDLDVIIVGRGGGSIEDLWAFNEEIVARAIFEARTPIISAIGHETDYTIADYVADMRAPTPSAAAELATIDYAKFQMDLNGIENILNSTIKSKIRSYRDKLERKTQKLEYLAPINKISEEKNRLEYLRKSCNNAMIRKMTDVKNKLAIRSQRLKGLSPLDTISSGYAYVTNNKNHKVTKADQVHITEELILSFSDGRVKTKVMEVFNGKEN